MKAYQTLKYLAFAGAISLWGCSKQQYAQNSEYDDLYFTSQDRQAATYTASTSPRDYSSVENKGVASEDYSQKNVNPEYVQQYAEQSRSNASTDSDDSYSADENTYYDESYSDNRVNLARNYNRRNAGSTINILPSYGFGGLYGSPAFYDPFYDPYFMYGRGFNDPFFPRPFYGMGMRSGLYIGFGAGFGWGNSWGWNDPFMYGGRWGNPYAFGGPWGWGDPFYSGFYGNPYRYGYGYGNNVIVVPGNTADRRTVQYGPRSGRSTGAVNNDFNNSPRSTRGGRVDNTNPDATTNPGGRGTGNTYSDGANPRAVRPRNNDNTDSRSNAPGYYNPQNNAGGRVSTPSSDAGAAGSSNPRAVRPRGNDATPSNSNRNYDYYNNSNRSSSPSYSNPSNNSTTSPRSNNNWNNSRSSGTDYNRSSGSDSRGSYSSPSYSPSPSSSGGSSSPRSSGSSGASPRSPR